MNKHIKVLALDLSSSSTGFAILDGGVLKETGVILPERYPNYTKDRYPKRTIKNCQSICRSIKDLVVRNDFDKIVIEEVNSGGISGVIQQKTMAGLHFLLLSNLMEYIDIIEFITCSTWRKTLDIRLSVEDKAHNKSCKNKRDKIGWKHLSLRWVEENYPNRTVSSHDIADAICIVVAHNRLM